MTVAATNQEVEQGFWATMWGGLPAVLDEVGTIVNDEPSVSDEQKANPQTTKPYNADISSQQLIPGVDNTHLYLAGAGIGVLLVTMLLLKKKK